MGAQQEQEPEVEAPSPEEAERLAREGAPVAVAEEPTSESAEVRPEEIAAGIERPVGDSAWPGEIVDELRKPLDPNRVRRREGRGSDKYEYLAGHDVKRRANEIFGFGNWGHTIVAQEEIGAIEVKSRSGSEGWHVAYRCVVRVWVRHAGGVFETHGSGYGDGVEYTAAARLTACELAIKESETDALKRAFTDLGDQFGLILYAKDDEKKRIEREGSRSDTHSTVRRNVDSKDEAPKTWPEAMLRFERRLGLAEVEFDEKGKPITPEAAAWLEELVEKRFGQPSIAELSGEDRVLAFAGFASVVCYLEDEVSDDFAFVTDLRDTLRRAFAAKNAGLALEGPPWRYGPNEPERPLRGEAPEVDPEAEAPAAPAEAETPAAAAAEEAAPASEPSAA